MGLPDAGRSRTGVPGRKARENELNCLREVLIRKTAARRAGVFVCRFVELLQQSLPLGGVDLRPFIKSRVVDGDRRGNAQQLRKLQVPGRERARLLAADREQAKNGVRN